MNSIPQSQELLGGLFGRGRRGSRIGGSRSRGGGRIASRSTSRGGSRIASRSGRITGGGRDDRGRGNGFRGGSRFAAADGLDSEAHNGRQSEQLLHGSDFL